MKKIFITLLFFSIFLSVNHAQNVKFGYVNSQELLASIPEVKQADAELETYQKQLVAKGQSMVKELETEYQQYVDQSKKGLLSQVQSQEKEAALNAKQQEIQKYEVEVQQKIAKKREELYKPILDKVKTTIEAYGKEKGYTMIFDTSMGTLLHANESDNLLEEIKARL